MPIQKSNHTTDSSNQKCSHFYTKLFYGYCNRFCEIAIKILWNTSSTNIRSHFHIISLAFFQLCCGTSLCRTGKLWQSCITVGTFLSVVNKITTFPARTCCTLGTPGKCYLTTGIFTYL